MPDNGEPGKQGNRRCSPLAGDTIVEVMHHYDEDGSHAGVWCEVEVSTRREMPLSMVRSRTCGESALLRGLYSFFVRKEKGYQDVKIDLAYRFASGGCEGL